VCFAFSLLPTLSEDFLPQVAQHAEVLPVRFPHRSRSGPPVLPEPAPLPFEDPVHETFAAEHGAVGQIPDPVADRLRHGQASGPGFFGFDFFPGEPAFPGLLSGFRDLPLFAFGIEAEPVETGGLGPAFLEIRPADGS